MALATSPYDGALSIDPTVNPAYLQLPAVQETPPIPYSPEGWAQSKIMQAGEDKAGTPAAPAPKKKSSVGFTPEQMLALSKLTGLQEQARGPAAPAVAAPRNQVGQMQQLQAQAGGVAQTAPRASLGQIIYGGRKF